MEKNVMIPHSLLSRIAGLLQCWDISGYGIETRDEYYDVVGEIELKMQKLGLRDAYSKIVRAKDGDARDWARAEYLQLREMVKGIGDRNGYC